MVSCGVQCPMYGSWICSIRIMYETRCSFHGAGRSAVDILVMCWAQNFVVCVLSSVVGSSVVPVWQSGGVRGSACYIREVMVWKEKLAG